MFFKPLETTTPARDVFKFVCDFLEGHGIAWKNLCTVCTDSPCHIGVQIRFLSFNRNCCSKCHWHTLNNSSTGVSCEISLGLRQIMSLAIQAVKFKNFQQTVFPMDAKSSTLDCSSVFCLLRRR
jgi:hypothetical protein